jgi:putative nucleotidyltransferase with HDIG domain
MTVQLDSIIQKVEQLPPLPASSVRIIQLATDPRASVDGILDVVRYDQSLTGQVLRLCNSAYFGLSRKIASLKEALAYLGSMPLLQLVLGVHCNAILQSAQPGYGLMSGMLWKHSSATALACDRVGRLVAAEKPEALFTAGLLHDIGKVILGNFLAERYEEILELITGNPMTFHEAERTVLGYTHAEVGELIAERWKLPDVIVASARYHHAPGEYEGQDATITQTVEVVHLADSVALTMGMGIGVDGLQYSIDTDVARKYQLMEKHLEKLTIEILGEVERLEAIYANW